uniref:Uncharacterized protein n=1 Tax=Anopheles maculatus TaxID=74869 RepID=A0A182TAL0_9DIPT
MKHLNNHQQQQHPFVGSPTQQHLLSSGSSVPQPHVVPTVSIASGGGILTSTSNSIGSSAATTTMQQQPRLSNVTLKPLAVMKQQQQQQQPSAAVNVSLKAVRNSPSSSQKGANVSSSMFYMKSNSSGTTASVATSSGSPLELQQMGSVYTTSTAQAVYHNNNPQATTIQQPGPMMIPVSSYGQQSTGSSSSSSSAPLNSIKLTAPIHHILGGSKQSGSSVGVNMLKSGKNQLIQIHQVSSQSRTQSPQLPAQGGTYIGAGGQQQVVLQQSPHTTPGAGGTAMMLNVPTSLAGGSKVSSGSRFTPSSTSAISSTGNYIVSSSSASGLGVFGTSATLTTTTSTPISSSAIGHKGLSNLYTAAATVGGYDQQTFAEAVSKYGGGKGSSNSLSSAMNTPAGPPSGGSPSAVKSGKSGAAGGGRGRHNSGSQFQLHSTSSLASSPPVAGVSQHYAALEHQPNIAVEQQALVNHTASSPSSYRYAYSSSPSGITSTRTVTTTPTGPSPSVDADMIYLNGQSDETATARILQSLSQKSHETSGSAAKMMYSINRNHSYDPAQPSGTSGTTVITGRHRYDSTSSTDGRRMSGSVEATTILYADSIPLKECHTTSTIAHGTATHYPARDDEEGNSVEVRPGPVDPSAGLFYILQAIMQDHTYCEPMSTNVTDHHHHHHQNAYPVP